MACGPGSQQGSEPTPIQYRTATALASVQRTAKEEPRTATPRPSPANLETPTMTSTPTPTIVVTPTTWSTQLTEGELNAVLELAGWPRELWAEARAVACGIGNQSGFPWGESNCHPGSRNGESLGLFEVWSGWFPYFGEDVNQWSDPVVNARTAWKVYQYDTARGQAPWTQWTVKP